jgi:muramoyltetrapeptide carboxypeptidase
MKSPVPELCVFFPASRFESENLALGLQKFRDSGFIVAEGAIRPEPHRFYCGQRSDRFQSLRAVLTAPRPAIAVAARGGYGSAELLELCDSAKVCWADKSILGFSDITALHAYLANKNIVSFHGPMAASADWLKASELEVASLRLALSGQSQSLSLSETIWVGPVPKAKPRQVQGRLVGGNLTVLASLMGTPWQLQLRQGDLLFLEDINEPEYSLARSLFQLSHSPNFNTCHLVWGHLTQCGASGNEPQKQLLAKLMEGFPNSWSYGLQAGHELPNMTLPLGSCATVTHNTLSF